MVKPSPRRDLRTEDLAGLVYASYVRDSTRDQAEGFGPEMQRHANATFATRYGLIDSGLVYEEYVSASTVTARGELQQALRDMRAGRYQVLLAGWTHRFARSVLDAEQTKADIRAMGGILVYSAQGIISDQEATRISERVHHILDEEYRLNLSKLVAAGLREKWEANGANGLPPLGTRHRYSRPDGTVIDWPEKHTHAFRVLNEAELPTLRALLTRYSDSGSYRLTADYLNRQGHHTKAGGPFSTASVKTIIRSPFYGPDEVVVYHAKYSDTVIRPTPPDRRLFPDDIHALWLRCQERRQRRGPVAGSASGAHSYPLHPVLRCATCDSVYHGQWQRDRRHSVHAGRPHGCASPQRFRSTLLEDQMIEALAQVEVPRNWRSRIRALLAAPATDDAAAERRAAERALEKLRVQHSADLVDDDTMRREARRLRARLAALAQRQPQPLAAYREPVELFRSIGRIIGHPAIREKEEGMRLFRRFCELAFERIEVDGARIIRLWPAETYRELLAVTLAAPVVAGCGREDSIPRHLTYRQPRPLLETSRGPVEIAGLEPILARLGGVA